MQPCRQAWLLLGCLCYAQAQRARVVGRQLFVENKLFEVRGVCYSPVPVNESVYFAPYGDYFTSEYSFIWLRDLPLIRAMGANTIRIYGWSPDKDHTAFLDAVEAHGLYLMATFYMGDATETSVATQEDRDKIISTFAGQAEMYKDHKAMLFWSFGNELNGVWNGFLQQLGHSKVSPCAWDDRYDDLGGCWVHVGKAPLPNMTCYWTSQCVYSRLYSFIEQAAQAAKEKADVLVVSGFADVDALDDKINRVGHLLPSLDAWTAQVYRGKTFGNFFEQLSDVSDKPLMLTEYGVDAYADVCGSSPHTPCYNTVGDDSGSFEDEGAQAMFAHNLTLEIQNVSSARGDCKDKGKGDTKCAAIGSFIMSWVDEYWKGAKSQAACVPTYSDPDFDVKTCDKKAHVTCGNWDASDHDLCGYWLEAAPDHYVNEEWFGITSPTVCGNAVQSIRPRQIYSTLQGLWADSLPADAAPPFPSCAELLVGSCPADEAGDLCSGHGSCATDWKVCGAGSTSSVATPCCSCSFGYAGKACADFDARIYVVGAAAGLLSFLFAAILLIRVGSALRRAVFAGGLKQPLLAGQSL